VIQKAKKIRKRPERKENYWAKVEWEWLSRFVLE